jgi:ABC-2 type transport system ATP-binding protein
VVVSSHDLADVEALADNVVVIDKGKLIAQGPLESLLSGTATRVEGVETVTASRVLREAGYEVTEGEMSLVVSGNDGSGIIRALSSQGIYPSEVKSARDTLESVFLGMTEPRE